VHKLVPKKVWKPRFDHIANFEALLAEQGTIVLKYFLHITKDEQEKRLLEREQDPRAAWKLSPADWKERELWDEYTDAYEDAISRTASKVAPWIIVPANAKWYRNLVIAESIAQALRERRDAWEERLKESDERSIVGDAVPDGMVLDQGKETIGVSPLDAVPTVVLKMPGDSLLPLLLTIGMAALFFGMLALSLWLIVLGGICEIVTLAAWLTPKPHEAEERVEL